MVTVGTHSIASIYPVAIGQLDDARAFLSLERPAVKVEASFSLFFLYPSLEQTPQHRITARESVKGKQVSCDRAETKVEEWWSERKMGVREKKEAYI